jgi:hypothetical protein
MDRASGLPLSRVGLDLRSMTSAIAAYANEPLRNAPGTSWLAFVAGDTQAHGSRRLAVVFKHCTAEESKAQRGILLTGCLSRVNHR